jgi:hypothetical protein
VCVCVCVCVHASVCVCVGVRVCVCPHARGCACAPVCVHACLCVCARQGVGVSSLLRLDPKMMTVLLGMIHTKSARLVFVCVILDCYSVLLRRCWCACVRVCCSVRVFVCVCVHLLGSASVLSLLQLDPKMMTCDNVMVCMCVWVCGCVLESGCVRKSRCFVINAIVSQKHDVASGYESNRECIGRYVCLRFVCACVRVFESVLDQVCVCEG